MINIQDKGLSKLDTDTQTRLCRGIITDFAGDLARIHFRIQYFQFSLAIARRRCLVFEI